MVRPRKIPSPGAEHPQPAKKPRKRRAIPPLLPPSVNGVLDSTIDIGVSIAPEPRDTPSAAQPVGWQSHGRLASDIACLPVAWLCPAMIPRGALTLIVGCPGTGKSTFGAWLCASAKRPAILPGSEESVATDLVPRLAAAGVALGRTMILDGRQWSLPSDRRALAEALVRHGADLLWIDPIDSYVGETPENDGQGVRAALEAFARLASDTGVSVVAARHPGKSAGNLCPGSRQWRAVPRLIWELVVDGADETRRLMRPWKPYAGVARLPQVYSLVGEGDAPRRFVLGGSVAASELETLGVSDLVERRKVDEAVDLIEALLAEAEQESSYVYSVADRERIGERTLRTAARRLGVEIRREGVGREHKSYWRLRHSGTPAD